MKKQMRAILCRGLVGLMVMGNSLSVLAALPLRVVVNEQQVKFPDGNAFLDENDRVLVPVRFVSEELGAHVVWSEQSQVVTITQNDKLISLKIGQKQMTIGDTKKSLDTAPVLKDGRTYVPVRFVSEGLGAEVLWDNKINTVYISNNGKKIQTEGVVATIGDFVIVPEKNWNIVRADANKGDWRFETDALLYITSVDKEHYAEGGRSLFTCIINMEDAQIGADYKKGCAQLEEVLRQNVKGETVDQIAAFLAQKTNRSTKIGEKIYEDGKYKIEVYGDERGYVPIYVYKK